MKQSGGLWLYLLALLLTGLGCQPLPDPAPAGPLIAWTTANPAAGTCQVHVLVNNPGTDGTLDFYLEAEPGILFKDTNSREDFRAVKNMFTTDARRQDFDCYLDSGPVQYSGKYVVQVRAHYGGTEAQLDEEPAYLYIAKEGNAAPEFLSGETEYAQYFANGYARGVGHVLYHIALDNGPIVTGGELYLKYVASMDGLSPTVSVAFASGIQFGLPPNGDVSQPVSLHQARINFGPMFAGAERAIAVPFELEPDIGLGRYSLQLVDNDGIQSTREVAPLAIAVNPQDTGTNGRITLASVTAQFIAPPAGFDPQVQVQPEPLATPPAPPPPPIPTATPPYIQTSLGWTNNVSGLSGSRWQVYQAYIVGRVPITWEVFDEEVLRWNPQLVSDNYLFLPHKSYLLPAGVEAPVQSR